jgi:hypothetical protein
MGEESRGSEAKALADHDRRVVQILTPGAWRGPLLVLVLLACGMVAILCAWLAPGLGRVAKIGLFATGLVTVCGAASLVWIETPGKGSQTAKPLLVLESGTRLVAIVLLAVFFAWELVVFERLVGDRGLLSPATVFSWIESETTTAHWSTAWPAAAVAMLAIAGLSVVIVTTVLAIRSISRGEGGD